MTSIPLGLLDHKGNPFKRKDYAKDNPPKLGRKFGAWDADETRFGSAIPKMRSLVQFDLDSLTLDDYGDMRTHPQVNSSLGVLSFMQHQSPWEIECDDKKIRDYVDAQLRKIWTTLNRHLSQANWSGYSPGVIEWENDLDGKSIGINKIMDLVPLECTVNWKQVEGWAPPTHVKPKFNIYDGIKQIGAPWPIPRENTLWYSLLMENGNYYGRKLLKAAFTPWYFSILIHLYANRYYERYGEPTPVGRAPFDSSEILDIPNGTNADGTSNVIQATGYQYMFQKMRDLRNRGVVVLPNEGQSDSSGKFHYDYELDFMESQMRGADFEKYLNRLDEEMSLALFTPVLLMRTADVGSYNLGTSHMQVYLWMMNAMNADRKQYIDKYLLSPLVDFNFGVNKPRATIKFRVLGNQDATILQSVVQGLINSNSAKPDLKELGAIIGLTLNEVKETVKTPAEQAAEKNTQTATDKTASKNESAVTTEKFAERDNPTLKVGLTDAATAGAKYWAQDAILGRIADRVKPQIEGVYRTQAWITKLDFGYAKQMIIAYRMAGITSPSQEVNSFYASLQEWCSAVLENELFATPEEFMEAFRDYTGAVASGNGTTES